MEEHPGHAGPDAHRIGPRVRRAVTTRLAATPPGGGGRRAMRAIRLGAIYFAAVFMVGFVLGAIRTLVLVPGWANPARWRSSCPSSSPPHGSSAAGCFVTADGRTGRRTSCGATG
jgi:hypothetical protein